MNAFKQINYNFISLYTQSLNSKGQGFETKIVTSNISKEIIIFTVVNRKLYKSCIWLHLLYGIIQSIYTVTIN